MSIIDIEESICTKRIKYFKVTVEVTPNKVLKNNNYTTELLKHCVKTISVGINSLELETFLYDEYKNIKTAHESFSQFVKWLSCHVFEHNSLFAKLFHDGYIHLIENTLGLEYERRTKAITEHNNKVEKEYDEGEENPKKLKQLDSVDDVRLYEEFVELITSKYVIINHVDEFDHVNIIGANILDYHFKVTITKQ